MSSGQNADKIMIARRIARELRDGDVVNLGIGLPTLVANYLPEGMSIWLESENGMVGMGRAPREEAQNPDIVDAGGQYCSILPQGAFFDSSKSFGLIRGGHVDICVLGALEVDEEGNLANWIIPGKLVPGMGGAMDLVTGAKRVIISMIHTVKGKHKILKKCTLPLTAVKEVDMIVTEMGVMEPVPGKGLVLKEIAKGLTPDDVQQATEARLVIAPDLREMDV